MATTTYPIGDKAEWPLRLPDSTPAEEVERLKAEVRRLTDAAQYGWGHEIDFGPFVQPGLLGSKYLRIAGTLDDIGKMFGLTRERARQIEEHAVRKLSSLAEAQGLREAA